MKKSRLGNIAFLVIYIIIILIAAEFIFRWMLFGNSKVFEFLREPSYYSNYIRQEFEDFHDENYWKLNYIFRRKFRNEEPHPLLGWTGYFDKKTLVHNESDNIGNKRPVLLYGNSFAMCKQQVKCFEEILNKDKDFTRGHYLLNYGVGGYGVDQIYLLLNETADMYNNPFIIFGLLTTNMDRCMLSVRDAQKPYFVITDSGLKLQGVPITMGSSEYFMKNRPEIRSYLFNKFRNSPLNPFGHSKKKTKDYIEKTKLLNTGILNEVIKKLKESEIEYVVLLFQPVDHYGRRDWRLNFLREYFHNNEVPYICDLDLRKADTSFTTYDLSNYTIPGDGHP
ncbi:MAG: hypothetical protein JSV22_07325, partial [Bacteroidales bacterium]